MVSRLIAAVTALLFGFWSVSASASWPSSSLSTHSTRSATINYITDAGATCNAVADDGPALANAGVLMRAAQTANPGRPVTLLIPPGVSCLWLSCPNGSDGGGRPFGSLTQFTLVAVGSTIFGNGSSCVVYTNDALIGASGSPAAVQHKFTTNLVGDTCVTMVTPGDEANYPVGRNVLVAGEGMQVNSFPPNYAQWEYAQVASTPAGKVCFTAGLKNAYPDSTVVIDLLAGGANCSNITCGGQGTLVLMSQSWGSTFHFIGGNWNFQTEVEWPEQTVIIDNMTVTSGGNNQNCYLPSISQTVVLNNVNWNGVGACTSEMDKEVDQIIVNGGTVSGNFQSASINTLALNNGATYFGTFPVHTICNNSTVNGQMKWGNNFGNALYTFAGTNCNLPTPISLFAAFFQGDNYIPTGGPGSGQFYYDSAGHFKGNPIDIYAGAPFLPDYMARGGRMTNQTDGLAGRCGSNDCGFHYTNTGSQYSPLVSTTGTLTINTNSALAAAAPPPNTGNIFTSPFVYPTVTCTGCFGNLQALDMNFAGAQNKSAFTYSNRTYTCANNLANVPGSIDINLALTIGELDVTGTLTSFKANVMVADTNPSDAGAASYTTNPFGGGFLVDITTGLATSSPLKAIIDLTQTGVRTITATTTSGAVGSDSLSAAGANGYIAATTIGGIASSVTNGPAAQCPVLNMEWITAVAF